MAGQEYVEQNVCPLPFKRVRESSESVHEGEYEEGNE